MKTALTVIFIIASILLIILVLMQEGKEAGLGSLTGAAAVSYTHLMPMPTTHGLRLVQYLSSSAWCQAIS